MPLSQQLADKLNAPGIDGTVVSAADGGDRLMVRVDQADALAVLVLELSLKTDKLTGAPMAHVKQVAQNLTERITYLLEPIQPIEADAEACVVQLRSVKPEESGGAATYYEVLVKTGGSVSLHRFEKPRGGLRREISMHLTKQVIQRLAADFLAAVA
jgi:hypothetical protein